MELSHVTQALRAVLPHLPAPGELAQPEARHTAERLRERLTRDLLPRLSGETPVLIAGIAGPNNVGKSSLFNALTGQALSPARAEGGLTKQCLAAAHPAVWNETLRTLLAERYEVLPVPTGEAAPVDRAGPPGRLYLVLAETLPRGLLLLDTPDFDSVFQTNRANTEALLVTVDVVVFVVSRHTYQNLALVRFLQEAVGHGRPYLLVYNEAPRLEVAREHLAKLAQDIGRPPEASFAALHQPEVEAGTAPLATVPLSGNVPLSSLLADPSHASALKRRALDAALQDARGELGHLASALSAESQAPDRLRARIRHELLQVGERAALKAVPADVLIRAFRDELDARSAVHRWIRTPFRALATALTFVGRKLHRSFTAPELASPTALAATEDALRDGLRSMVEALTPELHDVALDSSTRELLTKALGPVTLERLKAPLDLPEVRDAPEDRDRLYQFCRELIGEELTRGGDQETAIQALTTLVYSVPTGAAAMVTVATGGVGHDVVVWAGTLLSTPLMERFVDLLGAQIRQRVTRSWSEEHGRTLANAVERTFFAELLTHLDARVEQARARAGALETTAEALR